MATQEPNEYDFYRWDDDLRQILLDAVDEARKDGKRTNIYPLNTAIREIQKPLATKLTRIKKELQRLG